MDISVPVLVVGAVFLMLLPFSIVITKQKQLKHILLLGKYWRTTTPGLAFIIPIISWVDRVSDTNVKQMEVPLNLKTKDQVTFSISLKVFYKVVEDTSEAYKSEYNLNSYHMQMVSVATDSAIPVANSIILEHVFNYKEAILDQVEQALTVYFKEYGIEIEKVLSDEPQLPKEVEDSANEVIAAQRLNDAAKFKAEAIRTEKVGEASADGESVKIRMENVGKARKEYAETTSMAIGILQAAGVDPHTALNFLTRVGDQDALVTASRNSETSILSLAQPATVQNDVLPLMQAMNRNKENKPDPTAQ